jgi:hypothetical protein
VEIIRNNKLPKRSNPTGLVRKDNPGLGDKIVNKRSDDTSKDMLGSKLDNLIGIKGNEKIVNATTMLKNWEPPHEMLEYPNSNPDARPAIKRVFRDSPELIALRNKYKAVILRKSAKGSDLNHPRLPREMIGGENAMINAPNNPAGIPPIRLINKKEEKVVKAPKYTGKSTKKS